MSNLYHIATRVCAICGKEYIRPAEPIYNVRFARKTYNCCSYHCYQIAKQTKSENRQKDYQDEKID